MVTLRNWHKYAGLISASILFILAFTGFFLDHKNFSFLYNIEVSNKYLPDATIKKDQRLFESYIVDKKNDLIIVASKKGIFLNEKNRGFSKTLNKQCLSIQYDKLHDIYYAATDDGIYSSQDANRWSKFILQNNYINSLSIHENTMMAIIDKGKIVEIDIQTKSILNTAIVQIDEEQLKHSIKLSRFVRDVHYGRGLFDNGLSLLLNDISAIFLVFLSISGILIWYFIKKIKQKNTQYSKKLKSTLKLHGNFVGIILSIPFVLLSLSGIILDHNDFFAPYVKKITIPHSILPPIYDSLKEDIWSNDFDGKNYRIGNRYGVYISQDLKTWKFENPGLAYKMKRIDGTLYVSGMGAPNRIYKEGDKWNILKNSPHMFKDIWFENNELFFLAHDTKNLTLPIFNSTTLFSLLDSLHDGSFFSSWWVYINDIASILLLILLYTGIYRYLKKKNILKKKL